MREILRPGRCGLQPVATDLDIVIPTLNAAPTLGRTLAALEGNDLEMRVTVSDGGSSDGTVAIARQAGAAVVASSVTGRGPQLAAGAEAGSAAWLLFLHADTVLGPGWTAVVRGFTGRKANAGKAGYFRLRFDTPDRRARRVERLARLRCRLFGLPYGDQGLLISRALYDYLGGFRPLPLMEDVDLVRRIGAKNLVPLDAEALTSAGRYERDGWIRRPLRNLGCLSLYFLGVPTPTLQRLYGR